ncbi:MAG: hypothetical protein Q8L48_42435 [Archangium sp.]|nr:hypothetical protein [Archangium sp.]
MRPPLVLLAGLLGCAPPPGGAPPPPPPPVKDAGSVFVEPCLRVFPEDLDFGEVENSLGAVRQVQVTNTSTFLRTLRAVRPPRGFVLSPPIDDLGLQIAAGASHRFEVQFFPTDALLHLGSLELNAGLDCAARLPLSGLGSGEVLTVPASLDFGFVPPGTTKTLELQLVNTRRVPVQVRNLRLDSSMIQAFGGSLPSQLDLPALSTTSLMVTASPVTDETFFGDLLAVTAPFGALRTPLRVVGGAPVAALSATHLEVRHVRFDPGSASFAQRVVTLRNVSTSGRSDEAQLRLVPPFVTVEAPDGGPVDELSISPGAGAVMGLPLGAATEVLVHFTPTGVGSRSYRITLFTNAPVAPELGLTFDAEVESLPPCNGLSITPAVVLALTPTPDGKSAGSVTFENSGTSRCVVDDLRLEQGTPATFSITGGVQQLVVEPGTISTISVVGPRALLDSLGVLGFHALNPGSARQFISVSAPP